MKNTEGVFIRSFRAVALVAVLSVIAASCGVIGGIFKAGAIVGILAVVIILGLIFWIAGKFRGRG